MKNQYLSYMVHFGRWYTFRKYGCGGLNHQINENSWYVTPVKSRQYFYRIRICSSQGVAYRIGNLSNADISDFFVYRRVYRIEPPISSISIFSKPMIFLSFFAENSKKSPKILKIRRKFLKKKVFFEALISYRIVSYREKNPHIVSISYRIEKKLIATQCF